MLGGIVSRLSTGVNKSLLQVGWLLAATIIAGGFNYLANVMVGKLLGPEDYGVYASMIALSVIFGSPAGVIRTIIANYSARFAATSSNLGRVGAILLTARKTLLPWAISGVILVILGSGFINDFLNISKPTPVIVVGFTLIPAVLMPVAFGGLQGLQSTGGGSKNGPSAFFTSSRSESVRCLICPFPYPPTYVSDWMS